MANVLLGIHCVVAGCSNTQRRVNQWKVQPCNKPKHKGKSHAQCLCPEPYQFFKFPHEVKLQKLWLERVKRPDLEVNNLTRVCSLHFVEGKPTRRNYFPNIINVKKNVRLDEDEADNEEEVDEQYYEEETMQEESPPPSKRRGVSIVPMEMLQEQEGDEDDGMGHEDQGEEEYERNVTVSRYKLPGNVGEAYEVPTNSVTITRVSTTVAPTATPANKPSNRFISKTRVVEGSSGSSGNRFLWDRRTASSSSSSSVGGAAIRRNAQPVAKPSRPLISPAKKTILMRSRLEGRNAPATKVENVQEQQAEECPYEIDMLADENDDEDDIEDDGGDSSELSDIGIDIQTTKPPARKKHFTSKDLATAKTLSSLVVSRHMANAPTVPQKEGMQVHKPRVIPVLAVAPKTQLQQGAILQPIQAIGRTNLVAQQQQQNRKSGQNTFVTTSTSCKPIITSTTSLATSSSASSSNGPATNSVIAVTGSVPAKPEGTSIAPSSTTTAATSSSSAAVGQQQVAAVTPTLATYDPSRQQLQIANPVKYIQECHTRIAQLLAEKQTLESQNTDLEAKVQELLKSNNDLRREIVHQALNAARRAPPQQLATPTFNLVPTAILDNGSADPINNVNGSNNSSENGNSVVNNKTRIRYVIRRPANMPSGNTKK